MPDTEICPSKHCPFLGTTKGIVGLGTSQKLVNMSGLSHLPPRFVARTSTTSCFPQSPHARMDTSSEMDRDFALVPILTGMDPCLQPPVLCLSPMTGTHNVCFRTPVSSLHAILWFHGKYSQLSAQQGQRLV